MTLGGPQKKGPSNWYVFAGGNPSFLRPQSYVSNFIFGNGNLTSMKITPLRLVQQAVRESNKHETNKKNYVPTGFAIIARTS